MRSRIRANVRESPIVTITASYLWSESGALFSVFGHHGRESYAWQSQQFKLWSDSGELATFRERLLDMGVHPIISVPWERLPCNFWSHLTPCVPRVRVTDSPS